MKKEEEILNIIGIMKRKLTNIFADREVYY